MVDNFRVIDGIPAPAADRDIALVLGLSRPQMLTLIFALLASNALLSKIATGIARDGWIYSLINTFEVSAIVWGGLVLGIRYAWRVEPSPISPLDKVVAGAAVLVCLLPLSPITWPLMSIVALYFIATAPSSLSAQSHAGWIFLAVTVPMFWSKQLFSVFSNFFLAIDASLVASITGTERTSNIVAMPGGAGYLQIAAPCSSMANVSLALLCWVLFTQLNNSRWRPRNMMWCAFACLSVMAINVFRITLIGYFPQHFDLLHGPIGASVVSWVSLIVVVLVCNYGVRNGRNSAL
ncbi:hypothetical protein IE4872_PD02028 (plasmid) [Rhizobium gallicum]|uniref:Exosortase/archaeosortase family protein n=1 Tax=Rhizobium gallicum TaxID=56730 RepID=A0A1L5NX98_9HYPH|nr:exosortase/archaeosortase family protein [Rhizobium gallicum]APO72542.1 hypothetical protein IE4872_PD02028 [Rhizobium gallicum]